MQQNCCKYRFLIAYGHQSCFKHEECNRLPRNVKISSFPSAVPRIQMHEVKQWYSKYSKFQKLLISYHYHPLNRHSNTCRSLGYALFHSPFWHLSPDKKDFPLPRGNHGLSLFHATMSRSFAIKHACTSCTQQWEAMWNTEICRGKKTTACELLAFQKLESVLELDCYQCRM